MSTAAPLPTWQTSTDAAETLVLCSNHRLALGLRAQHDQAQRQAGRNRWISLNAVALDDWLNALHIDWAMLDVDPEAAPLDGTGTSARVLQATPMTPEQEATLWLSVIEADPDTHALLDVTNLARLSQEAHALLTLWGPIDVDAASTPETQAFSRWRQAMMTRADQLGLVDAARLQRAMVRLLESATTAPPLPRHVVWAGWVQDHPQLARLRSALSQRGVMQWRWPDQPPATSVTRCSAADTTTECLAVAQWVHAQLQADPNRRVAVVVPQLGQLRHQLEDALLDVLQPQAIDPTRAATQPPYNFSLGLPLSDYPLVRTALSLLDLSAHPESVAHDTLSQLLRDPYAWGGAPHAAASARIEVQLRRLVPEHAPLSQFVQALGTCRTAMGADVEASLTHVTNAWQALLRAPRHAQPPSAWARAWPQLLHASGWLSAGGLSSEDYQTDSKLRAIWSNLAGLDAITGKLDVHHALTLLRRLCRQTIFQPQTPGRPQVQVLGMLEACGLRFDATWVMGLSDTAWPPAPRPNPLLPLAWQRQHGLPNASPEVQGAFAHAVHDRLLAGAPSVTLSYPRTQDAAELAPSPLLALPNCNAPADTAIHPLDDPPGIPGVHVPWPPDADRWDKTGPDDQAPPVDADGRVPGGTGLLRAQARCPAWGYFQYRLMAQALEDPHQDLNERERGDLVHRALECFWGLVCTQDALLAQSTDDRDAVVHASIVQALANWQAQSGRTLGKRTHALEVTRLRRLICSWLALESERASPFTVIRREQRQAITLGPLHLNVSADRVDALPDDGGPVLIIDYKTGSTVDTKIWARARLTEPQLPLYATYALPGADVGGVVFARLKRSTKGQGWDGLLREPDWLGGQLALESKAKRKCFPVASFPTWADVLTHWRNALQTVAREIADGVASVTFDDEAELSHCDVLPLLRLPERRDLWLQAQARRTKGPGEPERAATSADRSDACPEAPANPPDDNLAPAWDTLPSPSPQDRAADQAARAQALRTDASFIVQAPAGAGKTELLTQRLLALLAQVAQPEEVVALTFTRKAAAEMRQRVLGSLSSAAHGVYPTAPHKQLTYQLASAVLDRDRQLCWGLLTQPSRLRITTLDALCANIVGQMPLLSKLGSQPRMADDPEPLYAQAVQDVLGLLDTDDPVADDLATVLNHLDGDAHKLSKVLADMLARREQWLHHVANPIEPAWVDRALGALVQADLDAIAARLPAGWLGRLIDAFRPAASNLLISGGLSDVDKQALDQLTRLSPTSPLDTTTLGALQALAQRVLTQKGILLKRLPAAWGLTGAAKAELASTLDAARDTPAEAALAQLRELPPPRLSDDELGFAQALSKVLKHAAAALWVQFQNQGLLDFSEVATRATQALGSTDAPSDLQMRLDYRLSHLLVDEFQDTSPTQIELLSKLTAGWTQGDGRTLFLVGDPMQSIYRFRKADVGLYLKVQAPNQRLLPVALTPLRLYLNNRSSQALVHWVNSTFAQVLGDQDDPLRGAVRFARAVCPDGAPVAGRVQFHAIIDAPDTTDADAAGDDDTSAGEDADDSPDTAMREALCVVRLIDQARARQPQATIAVLGRVRKHLLEVARQLRLSGQRFQAVELETLADSQIIQDLLSLTHALLHPADRLHALAVLRAPWCGLTLADLHALVADDHQHTVWQLAQDEARVAKLSADGQARLRRVRHVFTQAWQRREGWRLRRWIEGTWRALQGPACLRSEAEFAHARCYLDVLDRLAHGATLDLPRLHHDLNEQFLPPDPQAGPELQLMTVHKSKGLEFDVVIIPGLHRPPQGEDTPTSRWEEVPLPDTTTAGQPSLTATAIGVCASADAADDAPDGAVLRYLRKLEQQRGDYEARRLLYVAATRARHTLHAVGVAKLSKTDGSLMAPRKGSFLALLWAQAQPAFAQAAQDWLSDAQTQARALDAAVQPSQDAPGGSDQAPPIRPTWARFRPDLQRLSLSALTPPPASADPGCVADPSAQAPATPPPADRASTMRPLQAGADRADADVGIVVHRMLQLVAQTGLSAWSDDRLNRLQPAWQRWLTGLGYEGARAQSLAQRALAHLQTTLASPAGRWILGPHPQAASELAITSAEKDGSVRVHIIDRTFVDEDGVRWIVDYKTGPSDAPQADAWQSEPWLGYLAQLQRYRSLYAADEPVRLGLFLTGPGVWLPLPPSMNPVVA